MKVYLILGLYDNSAYVTEKVCLTKEIAFRIKSWKEEYKKREERKKNDILPYPKGIGYLNELWKQTKYIVWKH